MRWSDLYSIFTAAYKAASPGVRYTSGSQPCWSPPLTRIRFTLVLALFGRISLLAADTKPVTVDQIYSQEQATQPPQGIAWSPDGTRLSYIADNGDLLAIEGGTGTTRVLVDHARMQALNPPLTSEHDLNHRARYKQPSYSWVPDSKHLL